MKQILILLLTLLSSALAAENIEYAFLDKLPSIADKAKSIAQNWSGKSFDERMYSFDQGRDHDDANDDNNDDGPQEPSACEMDESALYNNTAISAAALDAFFFSFQWQDPALDLDEFFSKMNFDSECTAMGGEVFEIDWMTECPDLVTLEGYKLCRPPSCDSDFEYLITKDIMLALFGSFIQCEAKLISDLIPSGTCLLSQMGVYSEGYEDFLPERFISEGGIEWIENETKACRTFSNKSDMKVCDFGTLADTEEGKYIFEMCEDKGEMMFLDMALDVSNYHRTFRKYPYCKSPVCEASDIVKYYDYVTKYFTGEIPTDDTPLDDFFNSERRLSITEATTSSCDETVYYKASMKQKKGKALVKSCKWLRDRPLRKKKKFCSKKQGYGGHSPAATVCPSTCCACSEDGDNVFLKKYMIDDEGFMSIQTKTCQWLKDASKQTIASQCGKSAASYAGGFPPAYLACPETCGSCPLA